MPFCKNDSKKTYTGNEPSPKGLGYCAHAEPLEKKKKGKDGNKWIVTQTKNGIKRWSKYDKKKDDNKIKKFLNSNEGKKIINKYKNFLINYENITDSQVYNALFKYLLKDSMDRKEILRNNKWISFQDTLVREKIVEIINKKNN